MNRSEILTWSSGGSEPRGSQLSFDAAGRLNGLQVGAVKIIAELGPVRLGEVDWIPDRVRIEADEVEAIGFCGPVEVRIRHNVDHTWAVRIALHNTGPDEVRPGRLVLAAAAAEDSLLWVHAAGVLGFLTFHRRRDPACLALRVTRGDLVDDDDLLGTPELVLAPGGRYQLTLSGEWYADWGAVRQRYPTWFPGEVDLAHTDDRPIGHEDAATIVHDPDPQAPARIVRVEVSDAVGVTRVEAAYAAEPESYAELGEILQDRDRIESAAAGLCLYQAMVNRDLPEQPTLAMIREFLDDSDGEPGPLRVALRTQLHAWTGELAQLRTAEHELRLVQPGPGVPLAWLMVWAGQRLAEQQPSGIAEVVAKLRGLVGDPTVDPVTRAELALLVAVRDPVQRRRMADALREIELWCRGLPGQLWPPRSDLDWARAVVVSSLLPPQEGVEQVDLHQPVRRLLARAHEHRNRVEVMAWLSLRGRP